MNVIGLDPGLSGAIAYLQDGEPVEYALLPRIGEKGHHDFRAIAEWITERPKIDLAVLEHVSAMPSIPGADGKRRTMGATSAFSFGGSAMGLEAVLQVLGVPYQLVRPAAWKKAVLAGMPRGKDASVAYVRRRWPDVDLKPTPRSRKDSDALADAICLGFYGATLLQTTR